MQIMQECRRINAGAFPPLKGPKQEGSGLRCEEAPLGPGAGDLWDLRLLQGFPMSSDHQHGVTVPPGG